MLADPQKVTAARASQRQGKNAEVRQILALEQIADALECIRIELAGLSGSIGRQQSRPPGSPP
jgi:hypothetical protein